jgi:hypothetical protein
MIRGAALAAVTTGLLLLPGAVEAQDLAIEVTTVRATESGPCDPELESLRPRLRRLAGYHAYRLIGEQQRRVAWRNTAAFDLADGHSLKLLPKGMDDERVKMQVRLLDGRRRLLDTNIRLVNGGTMVFGVGRDARGGNRALLILLRVLRAKQKP